MLHRLALRVLPSLTLAVTEREVRQRKRLVMLAPGLVAFAIYRGVKHLIPLTEPLTLLLLSGVVSAVTAVWAYRAGRGVSLSAVWKEDGARLVSWLVGWIGFAYGIQLSLMVLALLKVLVNYDFLRHPDGPAMMALIIACTSVARDAFEIGHVRRLQRQGESVLTFPDGSALRSLFREQPGQIVRWTVLAAVVCAALAVGVAHLAEAGRSALGQLVMVSLVTGCLAVMAYLSGEQRAGGWRGMLGSVGRTELFRFWWWPGLAFAATYYLVLVGVVLFVLRVETLHEIGQGLLAGMVASIMALYCYYLGYRRHLEDQAQQIIPTSLLRCPFVMGILSKGGVRSNKESMPTAGISVAESGRRG
ncbi:MAG: hypothetical protein HY581_11730 [Nitrospirae bacterium]|nr:hypothetical protein [Nitrospirota bacterium]